MNESSNSYSPFLVKQIALELRDLLIHTIKHLDKMDKFLAILMVLKLQQEMVNLMDELTFKGDKKAIYAWLEREKKRKGL